MESTGVNFGEAWRVRPLCRRYLFVQFATTSLQARPATDAQIWPVTWALGALSDGQPEVLGVWQQLGEDALGWYRVFEDFSVRGVERIRIAAHLDAAAEQAMFPGLKVLNTTLIHSHDVVASAWRGAPNLTKASGARWGRLCDESEVPQRVRQVVGRVETAAYLLQRGLGQAAIRHGPFEGGNVAAAFVETWLADAERRQRRRRLAASRRAYLGTAVVVR